MKRTLSMALGLLLASSLAFSANSPAGQVERLDRLKTTIERIRRETGIPAAGIALVDKSGPLWIAGLGQADIENDIPADRDTLFRIGSASKIFSGLAILQLVEEGKLSLDDRLIDWAPDLEFENPWSETDPVRIIHLLEHTTGWDLRPGEYVQEEPDSVSLLEGLSRESRVAARRSRWKPGTRHAYSNAGPVVAALVVERVTGRRFEDYVRENLFNPLKMTSTTYFKDDIYQARGATLYLDGRPTDYARPYSRPSSSVNSSPRDMARLLQFFVNRGSLDGREILSDNAIVTMETPQSTLGASQGIKSGYGLTLQITGYNEAHTPLYGHSGGLPGAMTEFRYIPELEAGYVFMVNSSNPEAYARLSEALKDYFLEDRQGAEPEAMELPDRFRKLSGFYAPINPQGDFLRFTSDITGVMKITTSEKYLHRSPFMGGWASNDYAINNEPLLDPWTGLPGIAIVQDPLAGEAVQVGSDLYKRVSAGSVYARLALLASVILLTLSSILFALIWVPRRLLGRIKSNASIKVRLWPLLASCALLLLPVAILLMGNRPQDFGFSFASASVFGLTLVYPLLALISAFFIVRLWNKAPRNRVYWHSVIVTLAHVLFSTYIASYNLVGFMPWA